MFIWHTDADFQVILKKFKATLSNANKIITTTCILHNLIHPNVGSLPGTTDMSYPNTANLLPMRGRGGNATKEAFVV